MKIHKEGITIIIIAILVIFCINLGAFYLLSKEASMVIGIICLLALLLIVYFFRVPNRISNIIDSSVLAPCDGKVVVIEEVEDTEFLKERCRQISIFMSPLDIHINWHPVEGKILYTQHNSGKFHKAWLPKASYDNERTTIITELKDGTKILTRQIAGAMARRIVTYCKPNDNVKQGSQLGFIKFGSRMDVLIPLSAEVKVNLGDKVRGTQTVLAQLK